MNDHFFNSAGNGLAVMEHQLNVVFSEDASLRAIEELFGNACVVVRGEVGFPDDLDEYRSNALNLTSHRLGSKDVFSVDYYIVSDADTNLIQISLEQSSHVLAAAIIYPTGKTDVCYKYEEWSDLEGVVDTDISYSSSVSAPFPNLVWDYSKN